MTPFEVVISILVAIHTQSLRPHLNMRKTLYLVNPFKIKFKVTLNSGVLVVAGKRIAACTSEFQKVNNFQGGFEIGHMILPHSKKLFKSNTVFCIIIFFFIFTVPFKEMWNCVWTIFVVPQSVLRYGKAEISIPSWGCKFNATTEPNFENVSDSPGRVVKLI